MKNNFKIIILLLIFCFLFSLQASAASLNLASPVSEIGVGQKFYIDLMLDTEGSDINAVQGTVNFPGDILKFDSLNDGGSVVDFWVEKPAYKDGAVIFSGIIPGGFNGVLSPYYQGAKPGKILRLYLIAKAEGSALIKLTDAKVLLNDGKGTEAPLAISNFFAYVTTSADKQFTISNQIPKDTESPEDFKPQIVSDPNLFDGKRVLIWDAKDKGSGIGHYEIAEERGNNIARNYAELSWQTAESPYVLKDQSLESYIYIKAIDRDGNFRIVYLLPSYTPWYKKPLVDIIVGLGAIIVILLGIWLRKKLKVIHE